MYEYSPSNFYADLQQVAASAAPSLLEQKRAALVKFCLASYQSLSREMAEGAGEHLQALCQMAELQEGCWKDSDSLGKLWQQASTAPAFAMAVAKLAMQAGSTP